MKILELILNNFTTICLLTGLSIIIFSNKNFDKKTNNSFLLLNVVVFSLVITEIIDYMCSLKESPSFFSYFASSVGYTLRPVAIVVLINILLRRRKNNILIWIPIIIILLISSTTYFTHWMFYFNEINYFIRGPLAYISHIFSGIYLVALLTLILKMHSYITQSEIFAVLFSSFICLLATLLETISTYNFLLSGAMAVSCALYYIILYLETYKRDGLTGLLNRKSMIVSINKINKKSFTVISIDLNSLKEINDTYGHLEGDMALKYLANLFIEKSKGKYIPYRVGGDEFILIWKGQEKDKIENFFTEVKNELKKQKIMASMGFAFYNKGDDFENICNKADKEMYKDKKTYKHRD